MTSRKNNDINKYMEASRGAILLSLFMYTTFIASITMTAYMFWDTYFTKPNLILRFGTYLVFMLLLYIALTEIHDLADNLSKARLFSENLYMNLEYILVLLSAILSLDLITDITENIFGEIKTLFIIIDITLILVETVLLYVLGRKIVLDLDLRKLVNRLYGNVYGLIHSFWKKIMRKKLFADTTYLIFMMLFYSYLILGLQAIRVISVATGHITINSVLNCLVLIIMVKLVLYSLTVSYMMYTGIILSPEQKINIRNALLALNRRQPLVTAIYYSSIKELKAYIQEVFLNPLNDVIIIVPYNINTECVRFIREIENNNTAVIIYLRNQMIALQKLPISTDRKIFYISSPQFMQINYVIRDAKFTAPTLRMIMCLTEGNSLNEKTDAIMTYRFIRGIIDYFCRVRFARVFIEFVVPYDLPEHTSELLSLIVHDKYTLSK